MDSDQGNERRLSSSYGQSNVMQNHPHANWMRVREYNDFHQNFQNLRPLQIPPDRMSHVEYQGESRRESKAPVYLETLGLKDVWIEFCERTTIVGLDHILRRKSWLWRGLWGLVLIWGISMSVFQSLDIIHAFYHDNGIQRVQLFINDTLRLPSFTICNNIFIDYETGIFRTDKMLNKTIQQFDDLMLSNRSDTKKADELKQTILKHVGNLEYNRQREITGSSVDRLESFFLQCYIGNVICDFQSREDVFIFFHLTFGTCFTINPGFRRAHQADESSGIVLVLDMDSINRNQFINRNYIIFMVHDAGTAPVLHNSALITLKDEKAVKILMTLREQHRGGLCTDENDMSERVKMLHFTKETPFLYSTDSCTATCAMQFNMKRLGSLIEPNTWIMRDARFGNWTKFSLCIPPDCYPITEAATKKLCDTTCKPRCRETSVMTQVVRFPMENTDLEINRSEKRAKQRYVNVGYQTTMYEVVSEEYKYSVADFWGIVGGNVSLWIGVCLISLVELVELTILIGQAWIRQRSSEGPNTHNDVMPYNSMNGHRQLSAKNPYYNNN